nr:immunoglobulin domain-containing protein [Endozoicomonas sp.]
MNTFPQTIGSGTNSFLSTNTQKNKSETQGSRKTFLSTKPNASSEDTLPEKPCGKRKIKRQQVRELFLTRIETRIQPNCLSLALSEVLDKTTNDLLKYINKVNRAMKQPEVKEEELTAITKSAFYHIYQELNIAYDNNFLVSGCHQQFKDSKDIERPLLSTTKLLCENNANISLGDMISQLENSPTKELTIEEQNWLKFLGSAWEFAPDTKDPSNSEKPMTKAPLFSWSSAMHWATGCLGILLLFSRISSSSSAPLGKEPGIGLTAGSAEFPNGVSNLGQEATINQTENFGHDRAVVITESHHPSRNRRARPRSIHKLIAGGLITVMEGERAIIPCSYSPSNAAIGKNYWKYQNTIICRSDHAVHSPFKSSQIDCTHGVNRSGNLSLVIERADKLMSGTYICGVNDQATGSTIPREDSAKLVVLEHAQCSPEQAYINIGEKIEFQCSYNRSIERTSGHLMRFVPEEIGEKGTVNDIDRLMTFSISPGNPPVAPIRHKPDLAIPDIIQCDVEYSSSTIARCTSTINYKIGTKILAPESLTIGKKSTIRCVADYLKEYGVFLDETTITVDELPINRGNIIPYEDILLNVAVQDESEFDITIPDNATPGSIAVSCLMKYKGLIETKTIDIPIRNEIPEPEDIPPPVDFSCYDRSSGTQVIRMNIDIYSPSETGIVKTIGIPLTNEIPFYLKATTKPEVLNVQEGDAIAFRTETTIPLTTNGTTAPPTTNGTTAPLTTNGTTAPLTTNGTCL